MTEIQPCPHGHTPGTCRACLHAENERLKTALATANANHERFEREWYLRGDEIERLQADLQKALANHTADLSGLEPSSTEVESLRRENVRWENAHKIVLADNERLKRQVDELSTHAEKWVKRALAGTEDGSGPCDLVQQMRLAGYHDWASAVERLQRPWHEREAPHCSTCECGLVDVGRAMQEAATDWLESKAFYEVMQAYRHAHVVDQAFVVERFEAVKAFIRSALPPGDG